MLLDIEVRIGDVFDAIAAKNERGGWRGVDLAASKVPPALVEALKDQFIELDGVDIDNETAAHELPSHYFDCNHGDGDDHAEPLDTAMLAEFVDALARGSLGEALGLSTRLFDDEGERAAVEAAIRAGGRVV